MNPTTDSTPSLTIRLNHTNKTLMNALRSSNFSDNSTSPISASRLPSNLPTTEMSSHSSTSPTPGPGLVQIVPDRTALRSALAPPKIMRNSQLGALGNVIVPSHAPPTRPRRRLSFCTPKVTFDLSHRDDEPSPAKSNSHGPRCDDSNNVSSLVKSSSCRHRRSNHDNNESSTPKSLSRRHRRDRDDDDQEEHDGDDSISSTISDTDDSPEHEKAANTSEDRGAPLAAAIRDAPVNMDKPRKTRFDVIKEEALKDKQKNDVFPIIYKPNCVRFSCDENGPPPPKKNPPQEARKIYRRPPRTSAPIMGHHHRHMHQEEEYYQPRFAHLSSADSSSNYDFSYPAKPIKNTSIREILSSCEQRTRDNAQDDEQMFQREMQMMRQEGEMMRAKAVPQTPTVQTIYAELVDTWEEFKEFLSSFFAKLILFIVMVRCHFDPNKNVFN